MTGHAGSGLREDPERSRGPWRLGQASAHGCVCLTYPISAPLCASSFGLNGTCVPLCPLLAALCTAWGHVD